EGLETAAMPMHVAEAADVHQNVETQRLTGGEATQQLVVAAAMPHAEVDNLDLLCLGKSSHAVPNLTERIMARAIEQCGRDFDFKRLASLDQVDHRRGVDGTV